ncbi:NACHT domain-containing protein [Fusarium heterosporum]|uniref:NACHT domain-containing protein n=1 Tax=Fusarium heterosporum TaxID=42747 RepID=A0A8H5TTG7_FUSHE|nr:NACHT domain-containing protein [Fusarium heterosporum]
MPLRPAVSALARSTIKTAYDELDRTINLADKKDFANTTLEHVRNAALSMESQLATRESLQNMRRLMPLFQGLEHYSKVVDILCNGTPYLPWIWAPITLILRIASEFVEAFEHIIRGYASIAESLKRFKILHDVFINTPDFQQTLAVFYADILNFHKHAYKFVRRSGWRLMFTTSWGRFQRRFGNILEDLKQHGALIDLEANARNISQAKTMRDDIRKWREESETQVRREDVEQNAKQYESIVSWLKVNEADQIAVMDSISSEAADCQCTGGWLLKDKRVRSWASNHPDTPALWLKGSAGTGKSVLTAQLISFMKITKLVAFHFCTYLYTSSTMYEQILKSLLLQILRKDGDLVALIYQICILEKKSPTITLLEQLVQKLLTSMSSDPNQEEYLWIIIDGLDECDPDKQIRLIRLINQLTSRPAVPGNTVCKVLVSGRAPSSALEKLKRRQTISLSEEKRSLNESIRQYVDQKLITMHNKLRQLDLGPSEIGEIRDVIVAKADGMFLYARLVMDYLASNIFYNGREIMDSVKQLPQKLTDFYQRILTQILIQLDSRSVDRIRCVLGWIAFAKRPLCKPELLSAITFSAGDHGVSRLVPQFLLETCGTLIEERKDATLAFIHNSVKEVIRVAKGLHGFHIYATEFWTEYLLSWAASNHPTTEGASLSLIDIACELAERLERTMSSPSEGYTGKLMDKRLESLQQYRMLQKHVSRALQTRSLGNLELRVLGNRPVDKELQQNSNRLLATDGISNMLMSYQEVVKLILSSSYLIGLSTEELELFRVHFGATAYTCQLTSCSRATIGFETEKLLKEHESSHIRWFKCSTSGCQFPPFGSARALKSHMNKYHTITATPKRIRKSTAALVDTWTLPDRNPHISPNTISLRQAFSPIPILDDPFQDNSGNMNFEGPKQGSVSPQPSMLDSVYPYVSGIPPNISRTDYDLTLWMSDVEGDSTPWGENVLDGFDWQ